MDNPSLAEIFLSFQNYLNTEQTIREVTYFFVNYTYHNIYERLSQEIRNTLKDLDNDAREIATALQIIHQEGGEAKRKLFIPLIVHISFVCIPLFQCHKVV